MTVNYWGALQVTTSGSTYCLDAGGTSQGQALVINGCSLYTGAGSNGNPYHVRLRRSRRSRGAATPA